MFKNKAGNSQNLTVFKEKTIDIFLIVGYIYLGYISGIQLFKLGPA